MLTRNLALYSVCAQASMFLVYTLSCAPQVGARWEEFTAEEHTQLASTSFGLLTQGLLLHCHDQHVASLSTGMAIPRSLSRWHDPVYKSLPVVLPFLALEKTQCTCKCARDITCGLRACEKLVSVQWGGLPQAMPFAARQQWCWL